jgi:hypothetical protein
MQTMLHLELLKRHKGGSQSETKEKDNYDMFLNSQHFEGWRACWSSKMKLRQTYKQKFKMRSIYTTKKRGHLMQVEWKWCIKLNRDNMKYKFYTTHNLWEEAPLFSLPPYSIFCASPQGLHPNVTFPRDSQMWVPKLGLLLFQNLGHSYIFQTEYILIMWWQYLIAFNKIFSTKYSMPKLDLI